MDHQLFFAINGLAGQVAWLDALAKFLATSFLYVAVLGILLFAIKRKYWPNVLLAFGSALFARGVVVEVLKRLIYRARPFEILNVHQVIVDNERGNSFPSGHTVVFFAFAFAFYGTKWFWPMLILAALASVARIFVGVHYPFDILASIIIAAGVVVLLKPLFKNKFLR